MATVKKPGIKKVSPKQAAKPAPRPMQQQMAPQRQAPSPQGPPMMKKGGSVKKGCMKCGGKMKKK